MNKTINCESAVNRLFGIFFCFFYGTTIIGSVISTVVIGNGFPILNSNETNLTAVEEIISRCGINQDDIENSCGDGEIDHITLNMLMGIFRYPDRMVFSVNSVENHSNAI